MPVRVYAQVTPTRNDGSSNFRAAALVTNNGISLLPSFSLGKPAAQFDLSMFGKRLGFEPQIRYALEGKPWSYIFWLRYKAIKGDKFFLTVGAHPALIFRQLTATVNGIPRDYQAAQRYIAGEVAPNYRVSRKATIGLYYLRGHGLDRGTVSNTHFVALNSSFSNVKLYNKVYLRFVSQVYSLKQANNQGYYISTTSILYNPAFPLSVGAITNHTLRTEIPNSKPLIWNLSLIWTYSANFRQLKD